MIFYAETLSGRQVLLKNSRETVLSFDRDAPADLLKCSFLVDSLPETYSRIRAVEDGKTLFRGVVDEQITVMSSAGLHLQLICRSEEALLLDSEAPPGVITAPSLSVLETRLLAPLGLELGEGDRSRQIGELNILKGKSCWSVLAGFCRAYLGTVPRVDENGLVQCGEVPERHRELTGIISAELVLKPAERISEVWQQSYRGSYDTRYRNEAAPIPRRRYLSLNSGISPKALLKAGEQESFSLTVTCLGALWPVRDAKVSVTLPELGRFENLTVERALYRRNDQGEHTRLVLSKS